MFFLTDLEILISIWIPYTYVMKCDFIPSFDPPGSNNVIDWTDWYALKGVKKKLHFITNRYQ